MDRLLSRPILAAPPQSRHHCHHCHVLPTKSTLAVLRHRLPPPHRPSSPPAHHGCRCHFLAAPPQSSRCHTAMLPAAVIAAVRPPPLGSRRAALSLSQDPSRCSPSPPCSLPALFLPPRCHHHSSPAVFLPEMLVNARCSPRHRNRRSSLPFFHAAIPPSLPL